MSMSVGAYETIGSPTVPRNRSTRAPRRSTRREPPLDATDIQTAKTHNRSTRGVPALPQQQPERFVRCKRQVFALFNRLRRPTREMDTTSKIQMERELEPGTQSRVAYFGERRKTEREIAPLSVAVVMFIMLCLGMLGFGVAQKMAPLSDVTNMKDALHAPNGSFENVEYSIEPVTRQSETETSTK